jgi:hypothetical protein
MTGSHEVRGSIPLGSTNQIKQLQVTYSGHLFHLCAYSVRNRLGAVFSEAGMHSVYCE